jgi:hypothetical protein
MVMQLSHEQRFQVMMEEWRQCESGIRGLDTITFKIRAWVVTLVVGSIIAATRPDFDVSIWLVFGFILTFYFIDTMISSYKNIFIVRMQEISELIGKSALSEGGFNMNGYLRPAYPEKFKNKDHYKYLKQNFLNFDNWFFYFFMLITVLLYFKFSEIWCFMVSAISQIR